MRVFRFLRSLLNRERGITLLELLIVCLIFSVILLPLLLTSKSAYFSQALSSQQAELQLAVRAASEWLIKDLRKANVTEIVKTVNSPTDIHLKFNLGTWNSSTSVWDISSAYIDYSYDSNAKKLTRTYVPAIGSSVTLEFDNFIEPPFYTRYDGPDDPDNILSTTDLSSNKKLIVVLSAERTVRGTETISYRLVSQVKIRN